MLIDEYQDTKRIQYSIITAILKAGQGATKAFIVGDPNQAIYQSLGGYPIAFEDFKAMANIDLDELELSRNYRSSERIIEYFGNYNVHNTRIEAASEIWTLSSSGSSVSTLRLWASHLTRCAFSRHSGRILQA